MKLRSQLVLLAIVALLPVAVLAAVLGAFLIDQQRQTFRQGMEARVHALITAVDSELNGSIDVLRALASVRSLDEGDMNYFRDSAQQILQTQDNWSTINLALPDGQQIVNLLVAAGRDLPRIPASDGSLARVVETKKPAVGDLLVGPSTRRWDFAVRVPVIRDGDVRYILSAVVKPESIARLVASQGLPADWEGMVIDRNARIVARTVQPESSIGAFASEGMRRALGESFSGWYRGTDLEGVAKYRAYRRSEATGWTFAMAIPTQAVDATARRAIWIFGLALTGAVVVAFALATFVGRRIARPIAALASATGRLAKGESVIVEESARLGELRSLEGALRNAAGAQAALKRAEEQTRSIVDHVLDGIIMIDERGTIQSFNRAAEKLFGYGSAEVTGQNVKVLMPEPYRAGHDGFIANYVRSGQAKIIGIGREVLGQRKDGSTFPMDLAVSEFRIGERRYFTGIVRDITERKGAEQELRVSEERLAAEARALSKLNEASSRLWRAPTLGEGLETMLDATIDLLGADKGNIQLLEDGVLKIAAQRGFEQELLDSFLEVSTEEDSACGRSLRNGERIMIEDVETDLPYAPLRDIARAAGYRAVQSTPLIARSGVPLGIISTHWRSPYQPDEQDLRRLDLYVRQAADFIERFRADQQLRSSEERLRLALTAGRMGNWEWDLRTNVVTWSPDLEAIHGLAPGTFPGTFEAYRKDIHPDDREKVEHAIARSLEQDDHHVEYRIVLQDGLVRWVEGRGKVFRDSSCRPTRVVGVCTDVTERKLQEQALRDADRHKDEFLAMLSHELRNPLAALTTAAHVLRAAAPDDSTTAGAQGVLERQTQHMVRLIEDLLDVTRVRLGKLSLKREPLNLCDLITEATQAKRAAGGLEGRAAVSLELSPVWVNGDKARLEQIYTNLLDNALKFTPPTGAIRVTARQDRDDAVLRVADNGRGIGTDMLPKVFDLFVQAEQAMDRSEGGLGLGLALVRRLAEMHDGSVRAESRGIGQGAAFTVSLPAIAPIQVASASAPRQDKALRSLRILVVEDNEDARQMLRAVLRMEGHDVTEAANGATGIRAALEGKPDVVLLDIGLPDMNGYEVARRLRASPDGASMVLVALSGYGQDDDHGRTRAAGFDAHLVKPTAADRVSKILVELTDRVRVTAK